MMRASSVDVSGLHALTRAEIPSHNIVQNLVQRRAGKKKVVGDEETKKGVFEGRNEPGDNDGILTAVREG